MTKKTILALAATMLMLTSCHTEEKVLYFQDLQAGQTINTGDYTPVKYAPGDKLTVVVTSSKTPEMAMQFNLPIITTQAGTGRSYTNNQIAYYTIDENGCIDVPSLGRVAITGLTRSEAAAKIQTILREKLLRDAVVTITSSDQYITVLGEVARPGKVNFTKDGMTLLEALGECGDLTIQAKRSEIKVIRQEGSESKVYLVDIRSKDLLSSPVYRLQQNDIIYVQPNRVRMGQSTYNENSIRSISTWISVSSLLMSLGILIFK